MPGEQDRPGYRRSLSTAKNGGLAGGRSVLATYPAAELREAGLSSSAPITARVLQWRIGLPPGKGIRCLIYFSLLDRVGWAKFGRKLMQQATELRHTCVALDTQRWANPLHYKFYVDLGPKVQYCTVPNQVINPPEITPLPSHSLAAPKHSPSTPQHPPPTSSAPSSAPAARP